MLAPRLLTASVRAHGEAGAPTDDGRGEMVRGVPSARASASRGGISPTRSDRQLASMACGPLRFRVGRRESGPARLGWMVGDLWRRAHRLRISCTQSNIHAPHYERLRSAGLPLQTACAAGERIQPFKSACVRIGGHLNYSCAPGRSCSSDVRTMTRLGGMLSNRPLERPGANARAHVGAASAGRSAPGR